MTPLLFEQTLERRTEFIQSRVAARRSHDLETCRQAVFRSEPHRQPHARDTCEVCRDRGDVIEIHRHRVFKLFTELECSGRRRRRHENVSLLECRSKVPLNKRAHLLSTAVVSVVVASAERIRAEDDAALDLGAEAGLAGRCHHVFDGTAILGRYAEAKADRVELSEVARCLGREDEVVRLDGILKVRSIHFNNLSTEIGE